MNASLPLLEKVAEATVGIHAQVPASHVSAAVGLGTERRAGGVMIEPDGLILTVNYVVMGAQSIIVTLTGGEQHQGWVAAQDYTTGLGLVRIDGQHYPHLALAPSTVCELGQDVLVVSAVANEERRADSGLLTYFGPFDAIWEYELERCMMTTATNFGIGGGPICNSLAQVVGISYLSLAEVGRATLGVPSELFMAGRDDLVNHGRRTNVAPRPWLGVLSYTLRDHVVIAGVLPGGPSEKAGLRPGDVVLEVDGHKINERRAFYNALRSRHPGDFFSLKIFRNTQIQTVQVQCMQMEDYFG